MKTNRKEDFAQNTEQAWKVITANMINELKLSITNPLLFLVQFSAQQTLANEEIKAKVYSV